MKDGGPTIQPNRIPGAMNLEMVSKRMTLPSTSMDRKDLDNDDEEEEDDNEDDMLSNEVLRVDVMYIV
jgi:hypothetical protein